jgi:DNA topoisomerase I
VTDAQELERIASLAVPPAWTDVWINADPVGHLQAVGRDARGRKQYRYHPEWRRRRDDDKFERMLDFGRRLPRIREAIQRDLALPGLPRQKVLALIVQLLELTHMRVGGEEYRRLDRTYGLTTLRDRHARVRGSHIRFRYRGKGGKLHEIGIRDRRVARLIRRIQDLPGQRLFEYTDEDGARHPVTSDDVNDYLRTVSGADISAKDFRTWAGTVLAFRYLRAAPPPESAREQLRESRRALERVADELGNTVAVARSSYVDPELLPAWRDGALQRLRIPDAGRASGSQTPTAEEEAALLRVLTRRR